MSITCPRLPSLRRLATAGLGLAAALLPVLPAQAQSAEQLRVDSLFADWDDPSSPGCAIGIVRDGRFVYRRGYGMAHLEHGVPLSSRSTFYIASVSKQFVAAAVLLAAERGGLSLDDEVRRWIPELPDYGSSLTIRHLLHHTSGIRDIFELWDLAGEEFADVHEPEEALALIVRQNSLNFEPGSEYLYSNSGYFLLGVIVERAMGMSLREFADEAIFRPLGMTHSHFHDDRTHISKGRAIGHFEREDGSVGMVVSNFDLVGSGGLHTSVDDLLHWVRNFEENRLGDGGLIERLLTRGVLNDGDTISYAAGIVRTEYRGLPAFGHDGGSQGYLTDLLIFPEQRFAVICLCNTTGAPAARLTRRIADIYLADPFPETAAGEAGPVAGTGSETVRLGPTELARWAGAYRNPETGTIWEVSAGAEALTVAVNGFRFQLGPLARDRFRTIETPLDIRVRFQDEPRRIRAIFQDGDTATYEAVELVEPDETELAVYAGLYRSEELGADWNFRIREGQLVLEDRPDSPLNPTIRDEFRLNRWRITFVRAPDGAISGLRVDAGRVRDLFFARSEDCEPATEALDRR